MTATMKISARDIDHLTMTLTDPARVATQFEQLGFNLTPEDSDPRLICFQPADEDVPNYIDLTEGEFEGFTLAVNVAETKGEERSQRWENEDGLETEATIVVGDGAGPLPWLPVQHAVTVGLSERIQGHRSDRADPPPHGGRRRHRRRTRPPATGASARQQRALRAGRR